MSPVFHLVYISHASESLSYSDLLNILNSSRRNNARDNITGVLILRDGYFIQVLEGPEDKIQKLVSTIRRDNRNHTLNVLIEDHSQSRIFGDWSMAFLDGDISSNKTRDMVEFFEACLQSGSNTKESIMPLVRRFRASTRTFQ